MSILGLKTLPRNHPLHRVYDVTAGVIGVALVVFGLIGLLSSRARIAHVAMSTTFCVGCLVVGVVLIAAGVIGGNVAAHANAWTGAALIALGLVGLLLARRSDALEVSDVIVMFAVGLVLVAAGFYGQVGAASPYSEHRTPQDEDPPQVGEPATDPADVAPRRGQDGHAPDRARRRP